MTGFGKATFQLPNKKITVEIKSLNSKGLDINVRIPTVFREMELGIRNQLSVKLERGKIDFSLYIEATGEDTSSKLNTSIIMGYMNQMKTIVTHADEIELLKMAVQFPDALKTEREEIDENEWKAIENVIDQAVINIKKFRTEINLSINDMALAFDLNPPTLQRLESGGKTDLATLRRVQIYLKFPMVAMWQLTLTIGRLHAEVFHNIWNYFEKMAMKDKEINGK